MQKVNQLQSTDEFSISQYNSNASQLRVLKKPIIKDYVVCKCCNNQKPTVVEISSGFKLYECEDCGFVFTKSLKGKPLTESEKSVKEFRLKATSTETKNYISRAVEWLPNKNLKILNIGYDDPAIINLLNKKGHKIISVRNVNEVLEKYPNSKKQFDVILTTDTNSITDPIPTFKHLFNLLNDFGVHMIYSNMNLSTQEIIEKLQKSKKSSARPISFYRYHTLEKILDKINHDIVYLNSKMIIAR